MRVVLLRKFETDFAVFQFQVRGERTPAFRDEAIEQISFASGKKFLRLLLWDVPAKNCFV